MELRVNKSRAGGQIRHLHNGNEIGLYRKLSLINSGNQLHNHTTEKPLLHIKMITLTCKQTKDKEKDVHKIYHLATHAEKSNPEMKMLYEPLLFGNINMYDRETN